jgi:acetyl esterase/lipase
MRITRGLRWAMGGALAVSLVACSVGEDPNATSPSATTSSSSSSSVAPDPAVSSPQGSASASTDDPFDPAAVSTLDVPTTRPSGAKGPAPVVVLVPGGGWDTHDPSGFAPLASALTDAGLVVVTTSYRAGQEGKRFPVPVQDVQCAIAYADRAADDAGVGGGPVIVVGHSAGGHLAALAATSNNALGAQCADPLPTVAGLVGLGGVYDTLDFEPYLVDFFGTAQSNDPGLWETGDPIAYAELGEVPARLRVLLLAGLDDTVVPMNQATTYAAVLEKNRVRVTLQQLPGVDHMELFTPEVAAQPIIAFARALQR